ncbi:DUF4325 domain-containing protein [uncultured Prevotella sp.]|uniref:DUF4325 domain-containing protein n=1 Tax=uncultured Prevotella sp. TaxID=159272 RepID=UPI00266ECEA5|nr:DUF4325 domain-containing protein [uncultured Prevotella sp.]
MEKNIKVLDLLGPDIRSRSNAGAIEKIINESGNAKCVIDMEGVEFISRSFADELLEICKKSFSVIVNTHGVADTIIKIVSKSRSIRKEKHKGTEKIVKLRDMASLDLYFATF